MSYVARGVRRVRLSVNLARDVADALQAWCYLKHLSLTEGMRRAIAVWHFVESEREKGHKIVIIDRNERHRELVLND